MNELIESLKVCHANSFAFYLKAHNYHWNVEGENFPMLHDFFNKLYTEVHSAVDVIAELIRTLDEYTPGSLSDLKSRSQIPDERNVPSSEVMISNLFRDNQITLESLINGYKTAEKYSEFGISNALQDRIEIHKKHAWMLRSMIKENNNG